MNLNAVKTAITSKAGVAALKLSKNSPHILFGTGVVGVVATAVMASRATLNVHEIVDHHNADREAIARGAASNNPKYTKKMEQRDLTVLYTQTALKMVKNYAPTIAVGTLTILCFTGAHNILTRRNIALTAAYSAVDKAFREYRARVVEELGEEKDREFRYASETIETMEETKRGPVPKDLTRVDTKGHPSMYATFFNSSNKNWDRKPEYNLVFLRAQQGWANERLNRQGYLLLNDVLDALGMERTPAGCVVGWLKNGDGDRYVSFGVFENQNAEKFHDFMVGHEGELLLDFNVDGVIYDKI